MKRKIKPKPINMIMKLSRQEDALNEATQGLLKGRLAGAGPGTGRCNACKRSPNAALGSCATPDASAQSAARCYGVRGSFSGIVLS